MSATPTAADAPPSLAPDGLPELHERSVASGDVRLHVLSSEPAAGRETVLFVHGFPDCHRSWSHQLRAFSSEYRVACFDLRGAGRSTAPASTSAYRWPELLGDLNAVMDELVGKDGRLHLVAHDWGGVIAWKFVSEAAFAGRVLSYTALAAPHPDGVSLAFEALWRRRGWRALGPMLGQSLRSWYIWFFRFPGLPEWLLGRWGSAFWPRLSARIGMAGDAEFARPSRQQFAANSVNSINLYRALLRQGLFRVQPGVVTVPSQVIVPLQDFALDPVLYGALSRFVPRLHMVELDGNHWIHREQPQQVNRHIRAALRGELW